MSDHCTSHDRYDPNCLDCLDAMAAKEESELAPVSGSAALVELSKILKRARDRGCAEHGHEIKWLIELPMTDAEYKRFNDLTGWSADGQQNAPGEPRRETKL